MCKFGKLVESKQSANWITTNSTYLPLENIYWQSFLV